jgi:hypothetical protein
VVVESTGGPVFIVGSMGSGSTLLRLMLDSHERIAIPEETGFMRLVAVNRWIPKWYHGKDWYIRLDLTAEDYDAAMAGFFGGLFARYAEGRGKPRWGDKTPMNVWHLAEIARLFPDAAIVGIVRHPIATTESLMKRFHYGYQRAVRHWERQNRRLTADAVDLADRFVLLRYEDLVTRPAEAMADLLDWLGEPWSDAVLHHERVQAATGSGRTLDGHTRKDDPVDPSRVARRRPVLRASRRADAAERTAGMAELFGYDASDPTALAAIAGVRPVLVTGAELAERRAGLADRVDLSPPPRPRREGPYPHRSHKRRSR